MSIKEKLSQVDSKEKETPGEAKNHENSILARGKDTEKGTESPREVVAQTVMIPIAKLETNHGQIEGLPKNPRVLRDEHYEKLKQSLIDNPEMLTLRELLVYPHDNKYVVIGGNMRLRVLQELGVKQIPCKLIPTTTTVEQLKAYTIKDNVSGGEWNWDDIANDWDVDVLEGWGVEIFGMQGDIDDIFEENEETGKESEEKIIIHIPEELKDQKEQIVDNVKSILAPFKGLKIK